MGFFLKKSRLKTVTLGRQNPQNKGPEGMLEQMSALIADTQNSIPETYLFKKHPYKLCHFYYKNIFFFF